MKLRIEQPPIEVPIVFGKSIYSTEFCDLCRPLANKIALLADSSLLFAEKLVSFLQQNNLTVELFLLPPGEKAKTRETKQNLEDLLLKKQYGRDALIIALGGGASLDLAGFLASTYLRGIPLLFLPTTLLAMVDAAIGGKTAVDTTYGKNLIGANYFPKAIWMDLALLETLPKKEWLGGLAEVLKMGLIFDRTIWEEIEEKGFDPKDKAALKRLIEKAAAAKIHIVEKDPQEHSLRSILNFGHTVAHAIEQVSGFAWAHGEAVAIGCVAESYLSYRCGHLSESDLERILRLIRWLGYRFAPLPKSLFEPMLRDKKVKQGKIRFVLLKQIGTVFSSDNEYTHPIEEPMIREMLNWLYTLGN